jgi:hypothetical protein
MPKDNKKFIQEAIKRPGALTKKAEKRGMEPLDFAQQVIENPDRYDERTVKQARFALLLQRFNKGKK